MGRRRWLPLLAFDPGAIARLMSSPPHPIPLAPMGAGARRVREVQPATRLLHHHYRCEEHARRPEQHLLAAGGQRGDSGGAAGSGDGGRCLLVSTSGDGRGGGGAQGTAPAARHSRQYFRNTTVEWITARVCISRHFYHPRVGPILPGWVGGRRTNKPFGCRPSKLWLSAISPAGPTGITPSEAPVCTCDKRATRGGVQGQSASGRRRSALETHAGDAAVHVGHHDAVAGGAVPQVRRGAVPGPPSAGRCAPAKLNQSDACFLLCDGGSDGRI